MTIDVKVTFHMLADSKRYEMYAESGQEELRIYWNAGNNWLKFKLHEIKELQEFLQYVEEHKYNV